MKKVVPVLGRDVAWIDVGIPGVDTVGAMRPVEFCASPRRLRVGVAGRPRGLDDPRTMNRAAGLVTSAIFETPCQDLGDTGVIEATMFRGALRRRAPCTWVGEPRTDLFLSNGDRVAPRDLARVLRRAASMRGVRISLDGEALVFETRAPEDGFMRRLIHPSTRVALRRDEGLLGTGPYRLVRRGRGRYMLAKNPHHVGHPLFGASMDGASPELIEFVMYPRDDDGRARALVDAFNEQAIDFTLDLAPADLEDLRGGARQARCGTGVCALALDTQGVFETVALRRVVAMAIDREALASLCFSAPLANVATGLLPPSVFKSAEVRVQVPAPRRVVAADGRPDRELVLLRPDWPTAALPEPAKVSAALIEQLADAGLRVRDEPVADRLSFDQRLAAGGYDLALGTWGSEHPEPHAFLHALLHSSSIPRASCGVADHAVGRQNAARLHDAEIDGLLDAVRADASAANVGRCLAWVADQCPVVPLCYARTFAVSASSLAEIEWGSGGVPDLSTARFEA